MMDQIIEFADIGEHIDGPIKHYSSGMYVRLGFAVAVMVRPDILIVDEVIAVGDEEFQRKCYEYLYDLRRHGTSLLIVSHGLNQITDLCDEALWLKAGEVMEAGPSRKVVQSYLDSVNAREIEAAMRPSVLPNTPQGQAGPSPEDPADTLEFIDLPVESLPTRPIRRGSGEVWVTGIEYLNEEQAVSGMLISGRPATMRVHYRAETDVDELVLGIGVLDHKDQTPTGVNSSHTGGWAVPAGLGYVDFHATPLLLAAGSYRVTTIFHIGSHVVDVVDDGFPLLVREPGVEMVGAYLQPGSWSLNARPLRASVVSGD